MKKKVLMLQLSEQFDRNKSIEEQISHLLSESKVSGAAGANYFIEFDYYNPDVDIENIQRDSKEMTLALIVGQMMVNSINSGEMDHLLN